MFKYFIFFLSLFSFSCIESIETKKDGNMNCYYDEMLVFSGDINIDGLSLDAIDLDGTWNLCSDKKVLCILQLNKK